MPCMLKQSYELNPMTKGDRVRSPYYGEGTVLEAHPSIVLVNFDSCGLAPVYPNEIEED
jgi:hypothetical protein